MSDMIFYAYKNKRNGKLIKGTDYRRKNGPRQILVSWGPPLLLPVWLVEKEDHYFPPDPEYLDKGRCISRKSYKLVKVKVEEVEE